MWNSFLLCILVYLSFSLRSFKVCCTAPNNKCTLVFPFRAMYLLNFQFSGRVSLWTNNIFHATKKGKKNVVVSSSAVLARKYQEPSDRHSSSESWTKYKMKKIKSVFSYYCLKFLGTRDSWILLPFLLLFRGTTHLAGLLWLLLGTVVGLTLGYM